MTGRPPRLAGARWRILVHEWLGTKSRDGIRYGRAYDVSSNPRRPAQRAETVRKLNGLRPDLPPAPDLMTCTVLAGTEFDELAVGSWIHLEQQDAGLWWLNLGGVTIWVRADRDGRPRRVSVYGPDDYDGRRDGCQYSITWTGGENDPASPVTPLTHHHDMRRDSLCRRCASAWRYSLPPRLSTLPASSSGIHAASSSATLPAASSTACVCSLHDPEFRQWCGASLAGPAYSLMPHPQRE